MSNKLNEQSDFLVIGGGIAGLLFTLEAAKHGTVHLIVKEDFQSSSTQYAQGGINAVLDQNDSFESHIQDTLKCGYGLCDQAIVQDVVKEGPEIIQLLAQYGVNFTKRKDGSLSLRQEGAHSFHRVAHADDATGAEIMRALKDAVLENKNVKIFKHHMAIDLILEYQAGAKKINRYTKSLGAYILNNKTGKVSSFLAPVTYIATGGVGKIYPFTSNPHTATGDGIVMVYRAGINVVNMEFIQFHPSLLYHHKTSHFLISETVRGHGGKLLNHDGYRFMEEYAPEQLELAPRDVVARAIDMEMKKHSKPHVYLDISHKPQDKIIKYFPNIYQTLLDLDIDMSKEPIPVLPAAHYLCGGIEVDQAGETKCRGLFAGGECAFTGFHGANRLASNSLLEAAVFAQRSAKKVSENLKSYKEGFHTNVAPWIDHNFYDKYETSLIQPLWKEVRQFMWNYVGITRTDKRMERAIRRIQLLRQEIQDYYWNFKISKDLIELRNISIISELVIRSAYNRRESLGLHYNADHPNTTQNIHRDTILNKNI